MRRLILATAAAAALVATAATGASAAPLGSSGAVMHQGQRPMVTDVQYGPYRQDEYHHWHHWHHWHHRYWEHGRWYYR